MDTDNLISLALPRVDVAWLADIVAARAEQYEITADYCLQNEMYADEEMRKELATYVEGLKHGFSYDDSICEVSDGYEAMSLAQMMRELENRLRAALPSSQDS